MKGILILFSLAAALTSAASGQTANKPLSRENKSEQQLRALNREWADAVTNGDAAVLNRLFAADIIVTSGSGEIRSKAQQIKEDAPAAPDPDFIWTRPFTTEDVRVKVYKDAAVIAGLARWGFKYKNQGVNQERRYTHLYVKQQGKWRIVAQQTSSNLFKKPQTLQ